MNKLWTVVVTYGTKPNMAYATVPSKDSAEKLCEGAKERGYTDARIMEHDKYKKIRGR